MVRHWPGEVTAAHSHDVEQIVVVLEGSMCQGNRAFGPGTGFFTPGAQEVRPSHGARGSRASRVTPVATRLAPDWA